MVQSGHNYQLVASPQSTLPSAPPLPGPSDDGLAPPPYEEAIRIGPSSGRLPDAAAASGDTGHQTLSGGRAGTPAAADTGSASRAAQTGPAATAPPPPPSAGAADDPPSYQSLFGHIEDARQTSSGVRDFFSKVLLLPLGYLVRLLALLVLLFGPPATLLTVSIWHFFHCPVAFGVPVWTACFSAFQMVYFVVSPCCCDPRTCSGMASCLMYLFSWYVTGAIYVYPAWKPEFFEPRYEDDRGYCNYTMMMTAFVTVNLLLVLVIGLFVAVCVWIARD